MNVDDMELNAKAAYIKGLADGLKLDESKDEVKIINRLLDLVTDMASAITEVEDNYGELSDLIYDLNDEVESIKDDFYDGDPDFDFFDEDNPDYQITCDECGAEITVDEDTLLEGEIICPNCGGTVQFDFSELFSDEECSCGDPDCGGCGK